MSTSFIITVINFIQPGAPLAPGPNFYNADLNGDIRTDQDDLDRLIGLLLGQDVL